MFKGELPAMRELVYLASGFCMALLLILAWRYVSFRSSPAPVLPSTVNTQEARPSIQVTRIPRQLPPLAGNLPPEDTSPQIRGATQPDREGPPQAEAPSELTTAPPERATQVPHATTAEESHEALRRFVQESLQRTIDEDDNLRAVLREAAKAHLENRKEAPQ